MSCVSRREHRVPEQQTDLPRSHRSQHLLNAKDDSLPLLALVLRGRPCCCSITMAKPQKSRSDARKDSDGYRHVVRFPEIRGKIIAGVELSLSPDDCSITFNFQDKTCFTLNLQPSVRLNPELSDWKTGNYKPLKRWRPVRSDEKFSL